VRRYAILAGDTCLSMENMGLKFIQTAQYPNMCGRLGGNPDDLPTACGLVVASANITVDLEDMYSRTFGGCVGTSGTQAGNVEAHTLA